ncbi:MAG: glycosyltransferase family 8 protein [Roseburia sp.]
MDEVYNIVVAPNEKYLRYTAVLLESIFETNPEKKFHIFVLYSVLPQARIDTMTQYVEEKGSKITFLCVDEKKYRELPAMEERISIETYFRLEIQDLLPEDVERALYLDGDMIVCSDLAELYHTDFEGKYIAACGFSPKCEQGDEFNAGMILFNMAKMREDITFETYRKLTEKLEDGYYMDQGILNEQFGADGTKYVWKQKYNFTCPFYRKYKKEILGINPEYTLEDVVVMHFTGPGIRPWEARITGKEFASLSRQNLMEIFASQGYILDDLYIAFLEKWWKAAEATPFYEELLTEMYATKNEILEKVLMAVADSREYRLGHRILKLPRAIKRRFR